MNIALHGKELSLEHVPTTELILSMIHHRYKKVYLSRALASFLQEKINLPKHIHVFDLYDDLSSLDLVISLGGDGTLLDTVTYVGRAEIPILGVNMGRLGFLATFSRDTFIEHLTEIFEQPFRVEKRSLLRFESGMDAFNGLNFCLNEVAVLKQDSTSMITVHVSLDGEYMNSYWGDGLMVATPTGSTGYSLSCGGPLILPDSKSLVITPISPHNLNLRPLIIPDDKVLTLHVESRSEHFLVSLDSRSESVKHMIDIQIRKEDFYAHLIQPKQYSFFNTLKEKLHWGLDARN